MAFGVYGLILVGIEGTGFHPRAARDAAAACHCRGAACAAARPHAGVRDERRPHRLRPSAAQARSPVQRLRSLSPAVRHRLLRALRRDARRGLRAALARARAGARAAARAAEPGLYRHADADRGRIGRRPAHAFGAGAGALRRDGLDWTAETTRARAARRRLCHARAAPRDRRRELAHERPRIPPARRIARGSAPAGRALPSRRRPRRSTCRRRRSSICRRSPWRSRTPSCRRSSRAPGSSRWR